MNRMTLIGKLATDGELKYTESATPVLRLCVADHKRQGETWVTSFFEVVIFGELAKRYAPLCKKDLEVIAIGEYERREWTDRERRRRTAESLNANYFRVCMPA
jgi:single-stranded DNA-binding protein